MKSVLPFLIICSIDVQSQPCTPITDPRIKRELDSATHYFKLNQSEKGFPFLEKAISIDSTNFTALQIKSSWEAFFQKFENALQTTLKQIQLRPEVPYFYYDAGLFYRRLGNPEKSLAYLRKSIELFDIEIQELTNKNSNSSHPFFLRAVAMLFSDQENQGRTSLKAIYEKEKEYSDCPLWGHLDDPTDQLIVRWLDTDTGKESKK